MSINIRPAATSDIPRVVALYEAVCDQLAAGKNYPHWEKGTYPTLATAETALSEDALFVAMDGEEMVGTVVLNHHPEPGYEQANWQSPSDYGRIIVVHTLAVHPGHRGAGIAEALMDFAVDHARATGMVAVRLDVVWENTPAIRLYEKCGYTYAGTVDLGYGEHGIPWFRLYEFLTENS